MSSAKHLKKFSINQPIEILFPLFSAEGEKLLLMYFESKS